MLPLSIQIKNILPLLHKSKSNFVQANKFNEFLSHFGCSFKSYPGPDIPKKALRLFIYVFFPSHCMFHLALSVCQYNSLAFFLLLDVSVVVLVYVCVMYVWGSYTRMHAQEIIIKHINKEIAVYFLNCLILSWRSWWI